MRIYSAGFQPDVVRKTIWIPRFVSTVVKVVITVWLVAGAAGVASVRPTTQPAGAVAGGPYSDVTQVVITRQGKVAAIDDEEDGDDDQNDPDDPNDTLAAADAFWWGAADATLRASWTERERQPRSEALANQAVQAA